MYCCGGRGEPPPKEDNRVPPFSPRDATPRHAASRTPSDREPPLTVELGDPEGRPLFGWKFRVTHDPFVKLGRDKAPRRPVPDTCSSSARAATADSVRGSLEKRAGQAGLYAGVPARRHTASAASSSRPSPSATSEKWDLQSPLQYKLPWRTDALMATLAKPPPDGWDFDTLGEPMLPKVMKAWSYGLRVYGQPSAGLGCSAKQLPRLQAPRKQKPEAVGMRPQA